MEHSNDTLTHASSSQRNPVIGDLDREIAANPFRHRSSSDHLLRVLCPGPSLPWLLCLLGRIASLSGPSAFLSDVDPARSNGIIAWPDPSQIQPAAQHDACVLSPSMPLTCTQGKGVPITLPLVPGHLKKKIHSVKHPGCRHNPPAVHYQKGCNCIPMGCRCVSA